jgi:hypothetical protein
MGLLGYRQRWDSQNRIDRRGQAEQDKAEQDWPNRTGRDGLQSRTGRTGQAEQDCRTGLLGRTARIGLPGQD